MKRYRVTIDGHTYEVEVDDPRARPIVARVAGETAIVDVEPAAHGATAHLPIHPTALSSSISTVERAAGSARLPATGTAEQVLAAPIPGLVVAVMATLGQAVQRGDELVTIEAMKMFNVIRAPRPGTIQRVHVTERQRVSQGDPLVTFAS